MTSTWPSEAIDIVRGDLTAAFAYTTRFGGVSLSMVCPFGMLDEQAGTITTSVPLAFVDKLRRLAEAPEAALAFYRRDFGLSSTPGHVLAQGEVTFPDQPPPGHLEELHQRWTPFLGAVPMGGLVRRLGGDAYYDRRLPVTLHVRRLQYWPDERAEGSSTLVGDPAPLPPAPQPVPKQGTDALVEPKRYAKQLQRDTDHLIGYIGGDGLPVVLPFPTGVVDDRLTVARTDLPPGGRRAAVVGFWYRSELHGQGMLNARGWLDVSDDGATFAPSAIRKFNLTMGGFGQKVLVPIATGFAYRKAVRSVSVRDGAFVRPG